MNKLTKITNYLYLGSYNDVIKEYFRDINADVIINVAEECRNMLTNNDIIEYYHYPFKDDDDEIINEKFDEIADLIDMYISNKKTVFIHCYAGRSRSVSFVIAYLMKYQELDLNVSYTYVDKIRGIYPNLGFIKQLMDYELELIDYSSLDYDEICIKHIHDTTGFVTMEEVETTYYKCNKHVKLTISVLYNR